MRQILVIIIFLLVASILYADTVIMKDGDSIKGLVVDEYKDRITMNTVDGEIDILRKDIEDIEYDTPEQTFIQLGKSYEARALYDEAAFYYKKALEVNPRYTEARELYLASYTKSWREKERITKREIEWQNMIKDWWSKGDKEAPPPKIDKQLLLKKALGFSLVEKDGFFRVDALRPYSAAAKAGIQEKDVIVGIWGKLIRYRKIKEVIDELMGPKYSEVKLLVEREISIPIQRGSKNLYKELGILLAFDYEGLLVKDVTSGEVGEEAGFKEGDFVVAIDKNITRYLPLDRAIILINNTKDKKEIVFTIRRDITLRRELNYAK